MGFFVGNSEFFYRLFSIILQDQRHYKMALIFV